MRRDPTTLFCQIEGCDDGAGRPKLAQEVLEFPRGEILHGQDHVNVCLYHAVILMIPAKKSSGDHAA